MTKTRERYFDLLRVLAIVRVSVYHFFPLAALELAFPSMGVMFALAGSLMASSLGRQPARKVLYGRVRRLLPAFWIFSAVVVPAMLLVGWDEKPPPWHLIAWVVPFADPPSSSWGLEAAEVLWYLVTYLWLVALSPVLLWLYNRAKLMTILLPIAVMAALTAYEIPVEAVREVATDLSVFAACWILGFAHRDGSLRKVPAGLVTVLAAACVTGALYWSRTHPDAGGLKDIPVAYALYNAGFVLALLRWQPRMAWLTRRSGLDKWISLINARAVTIYLWNNVAIALCYPIGDALQVWRLGRFFEIGYVVVALALLADAVLLVGWVEDLAAKRRPRFLPWPASTSMVNAPATATLPPVFTAGAAKSRATTSRAATRRATTSRAMTRRAMSSRAATRRAMTRRATSSRATSSRAAASRAAVPVNGVSRR